jgi:hypothetical protein
LALPGSVKVKTSEFDGTVSITMEPAWAGTGMSTRMKLDLFWNSTLKADELILTVTVAGVETFSDGESLHFNVDGEITSFSSIDNTTDLGYDPGVYNSVASIPGQSWSAKRYVVSRAFVERLLAADRAAVKVDLQRHYAEDVLAKKAPTTALKAFRKFLVRLSEETASSEAEASGSSSPKK